MKHSTKPNLLYLGFAFPPGIQALHPEINPAGHAFETQMVEALREHFEIRSVGLLPFQVRTETCSAETSPGLPHSLCLVEKAPELFHRLHSLRQLRAAYQSWRLSGWQPQAILTYNLAPVYNGFIRWLRRQNTTARLVLLLADSARLGQKLSWVKRFRHRFKPLMMPDEEMLAYYDACIGLSQFTERYCQARNIPWLWMPGGCAPSKQCPVSDRTGADDCVFGYFGGLAPHTGIMNLAACFVIGSQPNRLRICGHGKLADDISALAKREKRIEYHGLLPSPDDCLRFAQSCDVLVNPRPLGWGNENNFPSKIFQYALTGRAILTTRLSGVDGVLGDAGFYFDERDFDNSLQRAIETVARLPRLEWARHGAAARERVLSHYSWPQQAARMAEFLARVIR